MAKSLAGYPKPASISLSLHVHLRNLLIPSLRKTTSPQMQAYRLQPPIRSHDNRSDIFNEVTVPQSLFPLINHSQT